MAVTGSGGPSAVASAAGAVAMERDDDPVLSAGELRRRQRPGNTPLANVRTARHASAELPATASGSHVSRLFGNIVILTLILCICILLSRRLCMLAGFL